MEERGVAEIDGWSWRVLVLHFMTTVDYLMSVLCLCSRAIARGVRQY